MTPRTLSRWRAKISRKRQHAELVITVRREAPTAVFKTETSREVDVSKEHGAFIFGVQQSAWCNFPESLT